MFPTLARSSFSFSESIVLRRLPTSVIVDRAPTRFMVISRAREPFSLTTTRRCLSTSSQPELQPKREAKLAGIKNDGSTRRWYKEVGVTSVQDYLRSDEGLRSGGSGLGLKDGQGQNEWVVLLDGRALRTPKDNRFIVPSKYLAHAIAAEWDAQIEKVKPSLMPLMSIATTAIDHLPETRMTVIGNLLMLLGSDTILYRASKEKQPKLAERQELLHEPLLSWFRDTFACGLELVNQDGTFRTKPLSEETLTKLRWYLHSQDDWTLASLDVISNQAKSLVIALAASKGRLNPQEATEASRAEEDVQIEQWGEVMAGHDLDKVGTLNNIASGSVFLQLLKLGFTTPPRTNIAPQ